MNKSRVDYRIKILFENIVSHVIDVSAEVMWPTTNVLCEDYSLNRTIDVFARPVVESGVFNIDDIQRRERHNARAAARITCDDD